MEKKYKFLYTAATVFKVLGWVVLVVGIILSIGIGVAMGTMGFKVPGELPMFGGFAAIYVVGGIIYAVAGWISLLASAQILYLLIDLEQNTRETAERLKTGSTG
ncbi:MAG: hypothetical protein KKF26_03205 [Chloroflexi bacterium]|nr:hypothetical protein [Chloroflexota bacterium]